MHTRRLKSGLGWGVQPLAGFDRVSVYQGSADTFVTLVAIVHDADVVVAVSASSATESANAATKQALLEAVGAVCQEAGGRILTPGLAELIIAAPIFRARHRITIPVTSLVSG